MAQLCPDSASSSPSDQWSNILHAGKVFVISQKVLEGAGWRSSDGSHRSELKDRLLLCLWDVDDGTSVWISIQSSGEHRIPLDEKLMFGQVDANWMDEARGSYHRVGTLWLLGRPGRPFRFDQAQKRAIKDSELKIIRGRFSSENVMALIEGRNADV